jgi:hypothetical protein
MLSAPDFPCLAPAPLTEALLTEALLAEALLAGWLLAGSVSPEPSNRGRGPQSGNVDP